MSLEILKTKEKLRTLIDAYATLGDGKKLSEQMGLFTPDANYAVYMNGVVVSSISGRENIEKEFSSHIALVKTYFTLNGQHSVKINGDTAIGVSFSQIKMIRENEGKQILTDYSVRYDDEYVQENGKWLIKNRNGYFIIIETRILNQAH